VLLVAAALVPALDAVRPAAAAVFPDSADVTYKEYWIPHSQFTGGCPELGTVRAAPAQYVEPGPCVKTLSLTLPDDFSGALKTELYIDFWREARDGSPIARFSINGGIERSATVGSPWSRSPYLAEIPKDAFQQGTLVRARSPPLSTTSRTSPFVYYGAPHPLVPGPGSDVTPPDAQLTGVGVAPRPVAR
jgi:hypothetical protein